MEFYDEYLSRATYAPTEKLHQWLTERLLTTFESKVKIDPQKKLKYLEIGSGTGRLARSLRKRKNISYIGVEPNKKLKHYLTKQGFDVRTESLPNFSTKFHSENKEGFDCVLSLHVIEHASNHEEARKWILEMSKLTKPGGYICIMAPNILDYKEYFWDSDWSHSYPITPNRLHQIGKDVGLTNFYYGTACAGSTNSAIKMLAKIVDLLIPHRIFDLFFTKFTNRPLVLGMKISLIWGLTFVIFQKPSEISR